MTKYEIYTDTFQFRMGTKNKGLIPSMSADEIFGVYMSCDTRVTSNSFDPYCVGRYDTEADAENAWESYKNWGRTHAVKGQTEWLLCGEIAWMEELEFDDDGETCTGVNETVHISAEPYNGED